MWRWDSTANEPKNKLRFGYNQFLELAHGLTNLWGVVHMPNGKGRPDCHYCAHHQFNAIELISPSEKVPRDIPGLFISTAPTTPYCTLWKVALPLLNDCRVCSDYRSAGQGRVTSTKAFLDGFNIVPRRGILYRYFYNDTRIKECMSLDSHPPEAIEGSTK